MFSKENVESLRYIIDCGHTIGLHFDEARYPEITGDLEAIRHKIVEEVKLLEFAINSQVKVVSMHKPSKVVLDADLQIPGIVNSYGQKFFREFKDLSDSRQRWQESVDEIIDTEEYDRLHILFTLFGIIKRK